jgi:large subunit ribosomal protein L2
MEKEKKKFSIILPSKKIIFIYSLNFIVIGRNDLIFSKFKVFGSAGKNKNNGKKSIVRGVAKNPIDHPHGGRTKTNKPEVSI